MAAAVSAAEAAYIRGGVEANVRADGRGSLDSRSAFVEFDVAVQTSGSCRVKVGNTELVVGVKASLGAPDAAHPDWGRIEIAAEVSPLCNLQPRSLSEPLAAAVASQLSRSGLEQALDLKALGIVPGRRCWVLYVDVLLLSLDGALASAASVGLKAALAATSVPRLTLVQGEDPEDEPDYELDDDPEAAVHLDVEKVPLVVAVAKIGEGVVVDPTAVEEACAAAVLLAGVLPNGELTGLTKELTGAVGAGDLLEMFEAASTQGRQMQAALSSFLGASGKVVSQIF